MVAKRDPRVQIATPYAAMRRTTRSPRHTFNVNITPFVITPFMIAPVLPGETLTNLVLQNRVYSDPLKHPNVGWWLEHFFFYVKHRDLDGRDDFAAMMLDPARDMSAYNSAADLFTYHAGGGINWLLLCYRRIVEEYFRDEGEAWNTPGTFIAGTNMALGQRSGKDVLDSLTEHSAKRAEAGRDPALDVNGDGTIRASEWDIAMQQWMAMRDAGLTTMDYEDFIRTYGVNVVREDEESPNLHRPEILRHVRTWTYPANTIDPSNGTPRPAVSWAVAERADKTRFFSEPGFIVGLTLARPKVYVNNQTGTFTGQMKDALRWLPAVLNDHYELSFMHMEEGVGPLPILDDDGGYWVDTRDLFVHGEQFTNRGASDLPGMAVSAAAGRRYPASADIAALFAGENIDLHADGVVSLSIKGRQTDRTPGTSL